MRFSLAIRSLFAAAVDWPLAFSAVIDGAFLLRVESSASNSNQKEGSPHHSETVKKNGRSTVAAGT
jgi:hypothetical protein